MAFISPFVPSLRRERCSRLASTNSLPCSSRRACWTSLARSHPYGDGGVPQEVDWTGYDREKLKKEFEEAERLYREEEIQREKEYQTPWAIVMSADIIQWDNNLFKESQEPGFNWDLSGINVVRMCERTALRALPSDTARLWAIQLKPESLLTFSVTREGEEQDKDNYLLVFETKEEAVRFADGLTADGENATLMDIAISTLKSICKDNNLVLGLVPAETLVSASKFTSGMR